MFGEIGSEFQYNDSYPLSKSGVPAQENSEFVFCGRTAIETVLHNEPWIKSALLPSYCCDSMIEPFRKAGIVVNFYSVNFSGHLKIDLQDNVEQDCILWCNYFGFLTKMPQLTKFHSHGGVIIEDITHSFYSCNQSNEQSDYLVASLRKWEPVLSGGYCLSKKEKFRITPQQVPNSYFVNLKMNAMLKKNQYLLGNKEINKEEYLHEYSSANEWIANNYSQKKIDPYSDWFLQTVDYQKHKEQRIANAKILYEGLQGSSNISFLFPVEEMDCPLFVPILIQNGMRDTIRKALIAEEIYCPVHWPPPRADCKSNLYKIELSLICDHRYNEEDMKRIVDVLKKESKRN